MKVTYYFGAGASVEAIPTTKKMVESIQSVIDDMNAEKYILNKDEHYDKHHRFSNINKYELQREFKSQLEWLRDIAKNNISIDTLARTLYVQKSVNLYYRLKLILTLYLIIEHVKPINLDRRYDNFMGFIVNNDGIVKYNNLNIVSWNYDFQFEKSFAKLNNLDKLSLVYNKINVYPFKNEYEQNKFSLYKVNGTTGFAPESQDNKPKPFSDDFNFEYNKEFIDDIVFNYKYLSDNPEQKELLLNFAWEDVNHKNSTIKLAKDNLKDTVILVVIGYSFPSYNLEIDKEIITNMGYLEKIYIQTSNKDHDEVKRSVESIHPEYKDLDISVIISNNTDTFLIPPELTMEEEFKPIENFYSK